MLTISEVAQYAGVSVRAVRHYHQLGLLPNPFAKSWDTAAMTPPPW